MKRKEASISPWAPRQITRSVLGYALPRRAFMLNGPTGCGQIALTFDDGPDPKLTPRLLDVLAAQGVVATFFVIGSRAEQHPGIVRRIVANGHALGNHSFSHGEPSTTSAYALAAEVSRTRRLLFDLAGVSSRLIRPPHGSVTAAKLLALWSQGNSVVLWNRDPKDFACSSADQVAQVFEERPLQSGNLVLLHDSYPFAAEILPSIIADCRRRGLEFTTAEVWRNAREVPERSPSSQRF